MIFFSQLPKVEHKLDEVDSLLSADIEAEVKRGKRAFDSIATEIQSKVQRSIPEIKDKIMQAGKWIVVPRNSHCYKLILHAAILLLESFWMKISKLGVYCLSPINPLWTKFFFSSFFGT